VAQPRGVGRTHYIAQVVRVTGDAKSGIAIRRVHHYLQAAGLAAWRGHGLCRGCDKQNVAGPDARQALLKPARHNPDRGRYVFMPTAA
jgi:hypothetical protein